MRRLPLSAAALGLCLLALGACRKADEAMQTIVLIDAEAGVRDSIGASRGTVFLKSAGDNELLNMLALPPPHDWPIKFVLAPKGGDASRRFAVTLTADDPVQKEAPLFGFEVSMGFVAGHTRTVQLQIANSCVAAGSDCRLGCEPLDVSAETLEAAETVQVQITCLKRSSAAATGGAGADGAGGADGALGNGMINVGGLAGRGPSGGTSAGSSAAGSGGAGPRSGAAGAPPPSGGAAAPAINTPDACAMNVCGEHGKCAASGSCECEPGYASEAAGKPCVDIDECQQDPARCGAGTCQNLEGDFTCACGGDSWLRPDKHGCGHIGDALSLTPLYRSGVPCQPQVAFFGASPGTAGKGLAVWITGDTNAQALWSASFDPATGWTLASQPVVAGVTGLDAPRLALNPDTGDGIVLWVQNNSGKSEVRHALRSSGRFGPPRTVTSIDGRAAQFLSAALSANGDGYATWSEVDSSYAHARVVAARFNRITQTWLGTETIAGADDSGYNALFSRLAVDAKGRALLVWTAATVGDGGMPNLVGKAYSARYEPASPGWQRRSELDALGSGLPDVALDATDANGGGQGMAIWQRGASSSGGQAVTASVFTPDAGWIKSAALSMTSGAIIMPRVGVMPGGNAFAIWTQQAGGALNVWGSVYDASTNKWSSPALPLGPQSSTLPPYTTEWAGIYFDLTDLAVDRQGGAVGVFSEFSGTNRVIRAVHVQPNTLELTSPIEVKRDTTPLPPSRVEVGLDAQGAGALIWDQPLSADPAAYQVFVSRIE